MKTLLIYFSATGNTRYGAQLIKTGIEQNENAHCDLVEISRFSEEAIEKYDLIGFASPVFAYQPALNMLALIKHLPEGRQKPCFTFVSYAGDLSNVHWIFKTQLEKRGYQVLAQKEMLAQGSWTVTRVPGRLEYEDEPSEPTQAGVLQFGQSLPAILSRHQAQTLTLPQPEFHLNVTHLISRFYNPPVLDNLFKIQVDPTLCNRCGRCERDCPTGKMKLANFPNPTGQCIGCYRCVNLCPQDAVETWQTKGKLRYKGLGEPIRSINKTLLE
jgi:flavodoxin/Pyruvate/2-oxoacid:ferredoxin oxidoreductase delta subunit